MQSEAIGPYHIRSHSEDRQGAVVRSLMPLGHMTTTVELDCERKQVLLHQGKTVDNIDDDKACRSKLAAEVKGDMDRLLTYWDPWGWHRVTFHGDLRPQVPEFAKATGMTLLEEAQPRGGRMARGPPDVGPLSHAPEELAAVRRGQLSEEPLAEPSEVQDSEREDADSARILCGHRPKSLGQVAFLVVPLAPSVAAADVQNDLPSPR